MENKLDKTPLHSDPRIPLAAERTFLAWIRTGLALMGFGFVVARFGIFIREWSVAQNIAVPTTHSVSVWIGTVLVILGIYLNFASMIRYRRYLRQLATGILPEPKPQLETTLALSLCVIGLIAVGYLFFVAQ